MQGNVQGPDVMVLENPDEDFGFYFTGNDKPLKKVSLSKINFNVEYRRH